MARAVLGKRAVNRGSKNNNSKLQSVPFRAVGGGYGSVDLTDDSRYDLTLNEYFSEWIIRKRKTARKPVTPYRYNMIYQNHFKDSLGSKRINAVTRHDILEFQATQLETVSPATVNYMVTLLTCILNDAVADEIISKNPASSIRRLQTTKKQSDGKHRALSTEEQKLFMKAARRSYYYELFAFLLMTGLRQGESAALRWENIDFENELLHIRSTLTLDLDGHVITGMPKSEASERDIPITADIRRILEKQKEKDLIIWEKNTSADKGLVFPSPNGNRMSNATANQAIARVLQYLRNKGTPVDHFSCHTFRNTFATRFIEQGGNPQTLKALLGHTSLAMTMDLYSHVMPNTKKKEMSKIKIST